MIYNGEAEASRIPAAWHGWMHYRTDMPPPQDSYEPRAWEKPHLPNLTGHAGRLSAARLDPRRRQAPEVTGDYEPWKPA